MSYREDRIRKAVEARGWTMVDIDHAEKRGPFRDANGWNYYTGGWSVRVERDGHAERLLTGFSMREVLAAVADLPDGGEG